MVRKPEHATTKIETKRLTMRMVELWGRLPVTRAVIPEHTTAMPIHAPEHKLLTTASTIRAMAPKIVIVTPHSVRAIPIPITAFRGKKGLSDP